MKTAVIIPVCNAAPCRDQFIAALKAQILPPYEVLAIDSASEDQTTDFFRSFGYAVHEIHRNDFNHGGTRRLATDLVEADIYVFLTQDALLHSSDSIARLIAPIEKNPNIGISYGRQLPHDNAKPLGAHARLFNYPPVSRTNTYGDATELGIKTCFSSDSFAAYRRTALLEVEGFPFCVIGTEDAYVAGRMLLAGWKVHYEATACVHHSHDYSLLPQLRRYFDIGVFYKRERWIAENFGHAGSEGLRFVLSEINYLCKNGYAWLMPYALLQNVAKLIGYRLGQLEHILPKWLKKRISMNPNYWEQCDA